MKHLKRYNENFFDKAVKYLTDKNFLITYQIENREATYHGDTPSGDPIEKDISKWMSKEYQYIIKSKDEKSAREKFESMWSREIQGSHPRPNLIIISVTSTKEELSNNKMHLF
jgi:hypothetical protein